MARKWWTLLTVSIATFMLLLDVTIVNVALPEIERDLGASLTDLQWVVDSYVLALAALTLMAGALADRLGRKLVFTVGLAAFTAASLFAGFAGDPLTLNVARGLQGIGGAAMFGTVLALIAQEFSPRERKVALGIWGASVGVGVAVGPLVGGALVDSIGWEWIFFVNVPVGLLTIALALTQLREARDPSPGRLDWAGLVTFSSALFLLVLGLLRGNGEGWSSPEIVGSLAGGAALLAAFVAIELRSSSPLLDLRLFRVPAFTGASIASFAVAASVFSMLLYIVLYLQNVLGHSPLEAGLRLLPITAMAFVFSPLAARLSERVPLRALIGVGLAVAGVGLLLAYGLEADSEWTALLPGMLLMGAGSASSTPPSPRPRSASCPRPRRRRARRSTTPSARSGSRSASPRSAPSSRGGSSRNSAISSRAGRPHCRGRRASLHPPSPRGMPTRRSRRHRRRRRPSSPMPHGRRSSPD